MENTQRNCEQNIESSLHDQPSQFSKNIIIYENIQNQDVSRLDQDPINICQNDKQSRKSSYDNSINEHLRDMREFEMTIDIYKDRQGRDYPSKNISRDLSKIEIKDGLTNLNINNRRLKKSNRDQESSYESINQNIILNGLEDQQKSQYAVVPVRDFKFDSHTNLQLSQNIQHYRKQTQSLIPNAIRAVTNLQYIKNMKILMERQKRQFEEYQDQSVVLNKSQRLEQHPLEQTTLLKRLGVLSSLNTQEKSHTQQLSNFASQPQKSPTLQKSLISLSTRKTLLNNQEELNLKQQTLTIPELKNIQNKNSKCRENSYQMFTSIAKRQQIREHFKLKHSTQSNDKLGSISQTLNLKQNMNKTQRLLPKLESNTYNDLSTSSLERKQVIKSEFLNDSKSDLDIYNSKENLKQINSYFSKESIDSRSKNQKHHQYSDFELQGIKATYLTNEHLDKQSNKINKREIPRKIKNKPSQRIHQIQTLREKSQTVLHQVPNKNMVDQNTGVDCISKNSKISRNQALFDDTQRSANVQSAFKTYQTYQNTNKQFDRNFMNQMNSDLPINLPQQNSSALNMPQIIKQNTQTYQHQLENTQRSLSQSSQNKFTNIRLRQVSQNSKYAKMNGVVLVDRFNQRNNALAKFLRDKQMI
eukprot:403362617